MWREDCYEICTLSKQYQKKPKHRKKNAQSAGQRNQFSNLYHIVPPQMQCLKTIFETQKEMCKAMFQIGHKILQINYPSIQYQQVAAQKSKSCDHRCQQKKIKTQMAKKQKKLSSKLLSKLEDIQQTKQQDESGKTNQIVNNNIRELDNLQNEDYFIAGVVKRRRERMKSTNSSKKSKSVSSEQLRKCLSRSSKSKPKKSRY